MQQRIKDFPKGSCARCLSMMLYYAQYKGFCLLCTIFYFHMYFKNHSQLLRPCGHATLIKNICCDVHLLVLTKLQKYPLTGESRFSPGLTDVKWPKFQNKSWAQGPFTPSVLRATRSETILEIVWNPFQRDSLATRNTQHAWCEQYHGLQWDL